MKRALPYLAAVASGAALALALPLVVPFLSIRQVDPAGWLEPVAWFALVPALLALRGAPSARAAALRGLVAGLGYFYVAIYWVSNAMTEFGGLSLGLSFVALTLLVLYMAAHWAAAFAVAWTIRARLGWPLHLHLPLVWAAFELSRNYLFSGFPWANVGYTQVRTLPVAQLAALAGVYALAAVVVLVNAVIAEAIAARREGRPLPRRAVVATAALLALVVAHGELRLRHVRARMAEAPKLTVGIVQPNVNQSVKNRARDNFDYILDRLVPLTVEADRRGADLVAWPESAYPMYLSPGVRSLALPGYELPVLSHAHLLLGAATIERLRGEGGERVSRVGNVNLLLTPRLEVLGGYQKHHLVPFGEYVPLQEWLPFLKQVVPSFAPSAPGAELAVLAFPAPGGQAVPDPAPEGRSAGAALGLVAPARAAEPAAPGDSVRLAPMICFDAIFPEINVAFARQPLEPELLVNSTNDAWYGYSSGPYQFLDIVRMRAIEAGKAVVRPAYAGVSAVLLPTGELAPGALEIGPVDLDRAPHPDEPARLLLAEVPRLRGRTPYTTVGDLFAYASALFTVAALAAALRAGRRPART
ncbi:MULTISPECIES: apolipoprotein N-acyltransferase [Anaeromyxobacter]|uniref:apolipoprotein N-acyltransferase n=3 Tax=Anaeromyxobacteraceae TaxID=1524215 RepID=UPI001F5AF915|nr:MULTISPECIES: apolipoprotein N-acyltransferase [unclassified Anaeromyxobacter]